MYLFTKKKIFSYTIIASMLLTGCGGGSSTSTDTQITQQETEPTTLSAAVATQVTSVPETTTSTVSQTPEPTTQVSTPDTSSTEPTTPSAEVATQVTSAPETTTSTVSQTPEPTTQVSTPDTSSVVVQKGQVKDSKSGVGLANVKVSIGGQSTLTDASGFYTLSNLPETQEAVVNFEKEGYLLGSTQIQLKASEDNNITSQNYLEYSIYAHDYQYHTEEIISSSRFAIDASTSYLDIDGNPYRGTLTVELTILDNGEEALLSTFPGKYQGINTNGETVQFNTYGLINILVKDSNGNRLGLADGQTATLGFKAVSLSEKPSTIPLWYYDHEQEVWFEEGYAELQEDGMYKGEISHFGTWSLNRPLEDAPGTYRARIVFGDGTPARNVRVHAIGANWISSDLSTDENGIFEINVIPDSSFQLKAYDYQNKYGATSGTIAAVASGDVIEDRM